MLLFTRKWSIGIVSLLFMGLLTLWNSIGLNRAFENLHSEQELLREDKLPIPSSSNDNDGEQDQLEIHANSDLESHIPDALKPVTFKGCCPDEEDWNSLKQTCLTEQACGNDSLYPFVSLEEKEFFKKYEMNRNTKRALRKQCEAANAQLRPSTTWCSDTTRNALAQFPAGCSRFSMAGGSGPYDRLLLFPSGKLAFCAIPKSGISQWLQFLRFTLGAKDYQSNPYNKVDSKHFYFDNLTPQSQDAIWLDPNSTWTKAMLIREPAERLLSAYLDKVAPNPNQSSENTAIQTRRNNNNTNKRKGRKRYNKRKRQRNQHGRRLSSNKPFGANITFEQFIDILAMQNITKFSDDYRGNSGISWMSDPHWRPQAWSCGLSEDLAQFDYVGTLDNAAHHTKTLLQQVNMWEDFGRHYRTSPKGMTKGPASSIWPPPPLKPGETAVGFQQEGTNTNDKHNRNSKSKLEQYYTPELMKKVRDIYWMDFQLWDAVKAAEKEGKSSGRDVLSKLKPECIQ